MDLNRIPMPLGVSGYSQGVEGCKTLGVRRPGRGRSESSRLGGLVAVGP